MVRLIAIINLCDFVTFFAGLCFCFLYDGNVELGRVLSLAIHGEMNTYASEDICVIFQTNQFFHQTVDRLPWHTEAAIS